MPGNSELTAQEFADRWSWPVAIFVVAVGFVLRVTNLGLLPPFIDESGGILAIRDYDLHPVMERIFLGKYAGYLVQRPFIEFANDPLWAGRALSGTIGTLSALLVAWTMRCMAGSRAALAAAVVVSLTPQLVFHDRLALPESIAVFFVAAGCGAWLVGRQQGSSGLQVIAGVLIGFACATKVYMAPVFLLLPALASQSAGGLRLFARKELPLLVAGICAAAVILFLSALDPTWEKSNSLSDLLRMPKMIVGDSAAKTPYWARLTAASGLFGGFLPAAGWLLLASGVFAPVAFRPRAFASLAVGFAVFLLYVVVFRSFAAARYFNVIWIPIAYGVGLAAARGHTAPEAGRQLWYTRGRVVVLCAAAVQFVFRDVRLLTSPESFQLPPSEAHQYFTGWPSGRGLPEVAGFFHARTLVDEKPILVVTLIGFRHGSTSLPLLRRANDPIRFVPAWEGNSYVVDQLPGWLGANTVYVLVEPMGTPVNFARIEQAGYQAEPVFTAPDFSDSRGYQIFRLTRK